MEITEASMQMFTGLLPIGPYFIFAPFALVISGQIFKTGQIKMSHIISLLTQLCLGKFKTGRNCLQL